MARPCAVGGAGRRHVVDRKDALQERYLRSRTRARLAPPSHYVPGSADFAAALRLGLGWGMLPDQQRNLDGTSSSSASTHDAILTSSCTGSSGRLHTPSLDSIAEAVRAAAGEHLT